MEVHLAVKLVYRHSTFKSEGNNSNLIKDGSYCAFVIAHTFCASRDTGISYRRCLLIQGYFCVVQNYAEKVELRKCSWYPKRKLGVTTHFSEIIKLESGKERHTLLCILKLFTNIVD